jgi:CheY-like chemotaxis protein
MSTMSKLLIVDDDPALLQLYRTRLAGLYEIIDTTDAEEAVALTLEHKPDAIMLDLMMPKFTGFELCNNLHALSYTSGIPIFVVSGESGAQFKQQCEHLGAKAYFEKPVDFAALKLALQTALLKKQPERRDFPRVRLRVPLKLRGTDAGGKPFEESLVTENVSARGFLCQCSASLVNGLKIEVFLTGEQERRAGTAQVVRAESIGAQLRRYGFQFVEQTPEWIFHRS